MLDANTVLRANPESKTIIAGFARLLRVNEDGLACLIRLDVFTEGGPFDVTMLKAPFFRPIKDIVDEVSEGHIFLDQDFETGLPSSKDQLSDVALAVFEDRSSLMMPLLDNDQLLFDPQLRGRLFESRAMEKSIDERRIRRLYYLYLWGGQTELAFAPRFDLRGGPGQPQKKGTNRRGRESLSSEDASEMALPDVLDKLEKGARQYYLPGSFTLDEAFVITKERYFVKEGVRQFRGKNEKLKDLLLPPAKLPSKKQFRYVCERIEKEEGKRKKLPRQIRPRGPDWEFRGKALHGVPGPGYRSEIDPTKLQIDLVSRYGRALNVGNATLYVIIDVWSGAYTGYAISLEPAGWALAASALRNCFQEKSEVFERLKPVYERYGIPCLYENEDWPCCHLPSRLTADRGEFVSNKAGLVPGIGIKVEITASYCPQRKGKVEAAIKEAKHHNFYKIPGRYPKFLKRGESDGKRKAALTLDELELLIVEIIIDLNNEPVPFENIPPEMIRDGETDVTHIGMYKWGLENCAGFTRKLSATDVYTHLMTPAKASVTPRGIYYKKNTFVSPRLHEGGYTVRAESEGHFPINIRYDEMHLDTVLFWDNNEWVPAINENEKIRRLKIAFKEFEIYRKDVEPKRRQAKDENIHRRYEKAKHHIGPMVGRAVDETKEARRGQPKSQSKKKIRISKKVDVVGTKLIDSQRTLSSYVNALENERKLGKHSPDEQLPPANPTQAAESVTQRSKDLWRSKYGNMDK